MSSVAQLTNKIKQLPQERLSQLVVVILLVYIASILADLTWRVIPRAELGDVNMPIQSQSAGANRGNAEMVDVRNLNALNIFGQHNAKKEEQVIEPVVDTSAPETTLQLTLSATVAEGNNSGKGTAIIENSGNQGTYGLDDKIGNTPAILKSVFADRVLIQNRGKLETLMLDGVEYDNMNIAHPTQKPDSRTNASNARQARDNFPRDKDGQLMMPGQQKKDEQARREETELRDRNRDNAQKSEKKVDNRENERLKERLSEQRENLVKGTANLNDFIRFSPVRQGGVVVGYRLNPGSEPSLFKMAGFRPNDLAVRLNGYNLSDTQQALTALRELRSMTEANIVVERDGLETEILFSLSNASADQNTRSAVKSSPTLVPSKSKRQ